MKFDQFQIGLNDRSSKLNFKLQGPVVLCDLANPRLG